MSFSVAHHHHHHHHQQQCQHHDCQLLFHLVLVKQPLFYLCSRHISEQSEEVQATEMSCESAEKGRVMTKQGICTNPH